MESFSPSQITPTITMSELIARLEAKLANPPAGTDPQQIAEALARARRAAAGP